MPSQLGERIRERRKAIGLTLEGLADKIGSSKSYIWELENKDVARPSAEKLHIIAEKLKTDVDYLLGVATEESASDKAFYRKYKTLNPKTKERLSQIMDMLDDEED